VVIYVPTISQPMTSRTATLRRPVEASTAMFIIPHVDPHSRQNRDYMSSAWAYSSASAGSNTLANAVESRAISYPLIDKSLSASAFICP
jgi:hypothetical protein